MSTRGDGVQVGYARVSTASQRTDHQVADLREAGCAPIFTDVVSGSADVLPQLDEALASLTEGDTLVVTALDRLGRKTVRLIELVQSLSSRGVAVRCLHQPISTEGPGGLVVLAVMAALAEVEATRTRERTRRGLEAAAAAGRKGGRPPIMTADKLEAAIALRSAGKTWAQCAEAVGVSRATLDRARQRHQRRLAERASES